MIAMIHVLGVTNYLYPFEFNVDHGSWRASVYQYQKGKTRYVYYKQTNYLLADSWWYCSFCLRKIRDFVFKMKAYSHTNQVRFSHFLDPKRIQNVLCSPIARSNALTKLICIRTKLNKKTGEGFYQTIKKMNKLGA
uniref:Uncharacterized protein n=1 Tax=Lactuca sativa TaxID=4236 RepID=A0A9R1VEY7_LACSA|nr:hypothetical protein LSAT_V11C500273580 [Lactuca sativa]